MADSCQCMAKPLQYYKVISLQLIKIMKKIFLIQWENKYFKLTSYIPQEKEMQKSKMAV